MRAFEIIAALIAGVATLFVLKLIGLVIKFALIIALLITLAAWLGARAIGREIRRARIVTETRQTCSCRVQAARPSLEAN